MGNDQSGPTTGFEVGKLAFFETSVQFEPSSGGLFSVQSFSSLHGQKLWQTALPLPVHRIRVFLKISKFANFGKSYGKVRLTRPLATLGAEPFLMCSGVCFPKCYVSKTGMSINKSVLVRAQAIFDWSDWTTRFPRTQDDYFGTV